MEDQPRIGLTRLVPLLQVSDIQETLRYYESALGFSVDYAWPNLEEPKWAQVSRDDVSFMFTLDLGTSTVSYTHLDVYKRQGSELISSSLGSS